MLGSIFYATGLLILVILTSNILKFNKINSTKEWFFKYKKFTGNIPKEENFRTNEEWKIHQSSQILSFIEKSWIFLGFLSSSWFIFMILIISNSVIKWVINPIQFSIIGKLIGIQYLILELIVILFLIINHFHLQINTKSVAIEIISKITF